MKNNINKSLFVYSILCLVLLFKESLITSNVREKVVGCEISLDENRFPQLTKAIFKDKTSFKKIWNDCVLVDSAIKHKVNRTVALNKLIEDKSNSPEFFELIKEIKELIKGIDEEQHINNRIAYNSILETKLAPSDNKSFFEVWNSAKSVSEKDQALNHLLSALADLINEKVEVVEIVSEGGEIDIARNNRLARYLNNLYSFMNNNKSKLSSASYKQNIEKLVNLINELQNNLSDKPEYRQSKENLEILRNKIK